MAVNPAFADWYRSAAVTPPAGQVDKRWAGVEALAKKPTPPLIAEYAKLFGSPNLAAADVSQEFRDAFKAQDDTFSVKEGMGEVRVLAGAVLRVVMESKSALVPMAALAVTSASFATREAGIPERDHTQTAEKILVAYSRSIRARGMPSLKSPKLTKERFTELVPAAPFAASQVPNIHDPILNALTELGSGVSSSIEAILQLAGVVRAREEELDVLWWLQTSFSRDLLKSFSEIGHTAGSLVFPMELADLTKILPGPDSIAAVLAHALRQANSPSSSEAITIANATNATSREWREQVRKKYSLGNSSFLFPILLAIHKSLDTDGGDEWLPVFRKASDIPADRPVSIMQIAMQLYRERMLIASLGGTAP